MYIISTYPLAVAFCLITMLCWGSWANTQKLSAANWRFELFYWDYVVGILLFSLVLGYTLGSFGSEGRSLQADIHQGLPLFVGLTILGGVVFNAANILLSAAISIVGMAVAFPVGIGIALVCGVLVNYLSPPRWRRASSLYRRSIHCPCDSSKCLCLQPVVYNPAGRSEEQRRERPAAVRCCWGFDGIFLYICGPINVP